MVRLHAYEEAQEDATRERLHFLQRLDHELKNPLTAMQIALANLEDTHDAEKQNEIRAGMRGQILRIGHLINDLRKLAMLEKGPIEQVPIQAGEMLNEAMMIIRDTPGIQDRHIVYDFDADELPVIIGDRDLLQLAVYNVLDNAFKFTSEGGTVTLRAYLDDGELVIQVQDTGRGISPEDLPHIWEDLYRGKGTQGVPGSGIGLAMVRSIIERHGGTTWAESQPGRGTTVSISLARTALE